MSTHLDPNVRQLRGRRPISYLDENVAIVDALNDAGLIYSDDDQCPTDNEDINDLFIDNADEIENVTEERAYLTHNTLSRITNNFSLNEDRDLVNELRSIGTDIDMDKEYLKSQCPSLSQLDLSFNVEMSDINLLELLDMMLFDNFWDVITTETNRYMHQQISANHPNQTAEVTSVQEMKCFIGILMRMSMVKCTNVKDYWNHTFKLSYISDVFPRDRFLYLLKYFHLVNNFDPIPEAEKLHKLKPVLMGYKKFSKCVLPGTNISVDESMVPFKGRNIMKTFIKSKHHGEGFRKFVASCPRTGYCYSCLFDDKRPWLQYFQNIVNITTAVICRLLDFTSNLTQHTIITDNYYTSLELLRTLKSHYSSTFIGTMRANRVPGEVEFQNLDGYLKYYINDEYGLLRYTDRKEVRFLTNVPQLMTSDLVNVSKRYRYRHANRLGILLIQGRAVLPNPPGSIYYSYNMGGVDVTDLKVSNYSLAMRHRRWWNRAFFFILTWPLATFKSCVN